LVSELRFCVEHPEAGFKTQPYIAISAFKSYSCPQTIPHYTLDI